MNNPLAQRAQYYLNESSRLSEELNLQVEYSAVLEAVLEELVGTEDFLKIMEVYSKPGSIDVRADGSIRGDKPGRNNKSNVARRIGQLGQIALQRQIMTPLSIGTPIKFNKEGSKGKEAQAQQRARDAVAAFKNHGGQVSIDPQTHGTLLPSASNDNTTGIPMKHAKQEGVPVHIDPTGESGPSFAWTGKETEVQAQTIAASAERLKRKGVETQAFIDRPADDRPPAPGQPPRMTGVMARAQNAAAAKKKRMAAGQDAASRSGMVTMKDHYDLVQGIMNLLTSNEKKNDIAVNELSDATHTSYREKATRNLAQRGLKAAVDGMHLGNAAARAVEWPDSISSEEIEALALDGQENANIIRKRQNGLLRSGRLKPLGGIPLDMTKPKNKGPIGKIRGAAEAQRKLLGKTKPINSSYEPNLVQGIMNLLANSRNENALSEGQAKMLRMQDSAKRQQARTGTVKPGLASDLDRAKKQNIIKSLGTTQLQGAMVSGNDMGYIGTPHLQRLGVGERLTGMRPAGDDRSGLSHSLVSASRNTGNFHPDTDGAGGDVGHVDKVNRYGKVKAELGQSISQAHKEANAMEAAKREARVAFETSRSRTPEEIKQLRIGHTRKITTYRATNNKDTSGNAPI